MIWIVLHLFALILAFKYSKSRLTKAAFAILFLIPLTNYYDQRTYIDRTKSGFGCVIKSDRNTNSSYYLIIEEDGKEQKYSLDGLKKPFDSSVIGECVNFEYFKDALGYKVMLSISQ